MKDALTDFSALAGFTALVLAGFLVSVPLGLTALGISLLLIAAGLARTEGT